MQQGLVGLPVRYGGKLFLRTWVGGWVGVGVSLKLNINFGELCGWWVYIVRVMVPNNGECEQ